MPEVSFAVMRAIFCLLLSFELCCDVREFRFGIPSTYMLGTVPVKRDDVDENDTPGAACIPGDPQPPSMVRTVDQATLHHTRHNGLSAARSNRILE
jgi:hypothetical protein